MDIDELDDFEELGTEESQENVEEYIDNIEDSIEHSEDSAETEDDILSSFLKSRGINPDSVKFENDKGEIEEKPFDSLTRDEQLQILGYENNSTDDLDEDEINLINQLRENNMSVQDYINYIGKAAVDNYLSNVSNTQYEIDSIPDDELFIIDLKSRMPDLSDAEILDELSAAQANEELFNKKMQNIRADYKERENLALQQKQAEQQAEQQKQAEQFEQIIINAIQDNESIDLGESYLQLSDDDKNEIASFILDSDVAGTRYIDKALSDPNTLVKMVWYALKGDEAFAEMSNYYKNEIKKAAKSNYEKGYNDAKSGKTTKSVVRKTQKQNDKTILSIDDLD